MTKDDGEDEVEGFSDDEDAADSRTKRARLRGRNGAVVPDHPELLPHFRSIDRLHEAGDHGVEWDAMTADKGERVELRYEERRQKREAKAKAKASKKKGRKGGGGRGKKRGYRGRGRSN